MEWLCREDRGQVGVLIASEPSSGGENVTIGRIRKKSSPTLHLDFDLHSSAANFYVFSFFDHSYFFYTLLCSIYCLRNYRHQNSACRPCATPSNGGTTKSVARFRAARNGVSSRSTRSVPANERLEYLPMIRAFFTPDLKTNVLTSTGLLPPCQRLQCQEG